ncbi:serine protease [Photobacterium gaetbulicola]|uniref:Putative trypsin-like serine protease n=1 Tax=Photobacterium gaetbulicola Gung47 TaxID=658445 RepID=A0A0C5WRH2_9GAMM|nr:serine protease [Photobacterium gaetbulicola]AJR09733.1 putative trypsin-like serine protease [Photobacterium gaetbulicola Gung47]PSU06376.1 serine protease [Photobacterium gaetbulicola]
MRKLLFIMLSWAMWLPFYVHSDDPVPQPKIIGGIESGSSEIPWQAYLNMTFGEGANERTFICGGVVISADVVLTAAHCMRNGFETAKPSKVKVWAGITSIFSAGSLNAVAVHEIVLHPQYNASRFANDMAIVKLSSPLPDNAQPIRLASADDQQRADEAFANGWVTNGERQPNLLVSGWGSTDASNASSGATRLRQTLLSGVPDNICDSMWGANINSSEYGIFLCAGSVSPTLGRDSCFGDSGGPLVWQDPLRAADSDFGLRLVGLVSFGEGCAGRLPGVYSEVASQRSWLESEIGQGALDQPMATFAVDPFLANYEGAGEVVDGGQSVASGGGNSGSSGGGLGLGGLALLVAVTWLRRRVMGQALSR